MTKTRTKTTVVIREYQDDDSADLECSELHLVFEDGCVPQLSLVLPHGEIIATGGDIPLVCRRFREMFTEVEEELEKR